MPSIDVTTQCPRCKKITLLNIPEDEWKEYQRGEKLIQYALPSLNADQREMLISGLCETCWEKIFS